MALSIGSQLGSHEITALLGKGGMGEVYRARDLKLKREVAIKILPEEEMATRATLAALGELKPCEAASISPGNNQSE